MVYAQPKGRLMGKLTSILSAVIVAGGFAASAVDSDPAEDFYEKECWEDEVVVEVVHDPYDLTDDTLGCVPADNLPWEGNRPQR